MITSIFSLGSLVGCLITSWLGPRWGRRTWILVGNAINVVGTIISTASFSSGQLIAGRIVVVSLSCSVYDFCPFQLELNPAQKILI